MDASDRDQFLKKELLYVDTYLTNLQQTPAWRLFTTAALARDARHGLRRCAALIGYTGEWWRDAWLYLASTMPLLLPINLTFGAVLFGTLVAFITDALTVVEMKPLVVEKTIDVPFLYFFTRKTTISETIMVPDVHPPHWAVSNLAAILLILVGLLMLSTALKYAWSREIEFRKRRLYLLWQRSQSAQPKSAA